MLDQTFQERLRRAYMRESAQVQLYAMMADLAPNDVYRQTLLRFQQNEIRNAQYLGSLLAAMALAEPPAPLQVERPHSFLDAIRRAHVEELQEVVEYDELSRMAPTAGMRAGLWWVMEDQVQHFLFFSHTQYLLEAQQGLG
ncbi:MAG TPA: hypothetical protein GX513_01075 [Firmicutes bacterium]|nr:hypothetical protein [Bacillota bacterium]